jgi:hypothetical protein
MVIAGGAFDAQVVGELSRGLSGSSGHPGDFDVAQAAQCFGVNAAHKTDAKDCDFQFLHRCFQWVTDNKLFQEWSAPDFLLNLVVLANFMRLSLLKGADGAASCAAWQEIRVGSG